MFRIKTHMWPLAAILALAMAVGVQGQTVLIDDFEDGDLDGWTLLDFSAGYDWGPGGFDASTGELRMWHTGPSPVPAGVPGIVQTTLFAFWDDSTDPMYSNGVLRAKIRTDAPENSTAIHMRADLSTFSTYFFAGTTLSVTPGPGEPNRLGLFSIVGGMQTDLWYSDFDYLPGEDWNVELGVIGDEITIKAWEVGTSEPLEPLGRFYDDALSYGEILLTSDTVGGNGRVVPAQADGSFDDVYFTMVPEPLAIAVDIKPGSSRNPINLSSKGVLPVAIISTPDIYAPDIMVDNFLFGDPDLMNEGAIPVEPLRTSVEDVSGDGIMDLTLKFSMRELLANGVLGPNSMEGRLAGYVDGVPQFIGRDSFGIVPMMAAIPEPTTFSLLVLALGGLLRLRR